MSEVWFITGAGSGIGLPVILLAPTYTAQMMKTVNR